ncbi:hypothetical protein A4S05_09070 [Nostoc sp. KVJ20]|uniref:hypothetical protein n=1 Tax=Nostoc sp. KVJ20 TaxID=457944 RepID=UPI00083CD5CD|nr:hypothetical protein [Nostoc sp. KVJ20]ODG98469.1 hypothetical protein A4S05_09070 [Nostoc sp. KVJ20]
MSELIVVGFDDKFKAEDVLLGLLKLEQKNLLALDDAVVVLSDINKRNGSISRWARSRFRLFG